jgi:signal transduction histidine kinase/HAMP domain-containing protein
MARRIRRPRVSDRPRPWIGMRIWLGAVFALVGAITAVTVYQFVHDSNESVISERSNELAVGRTIKLADQVGDAKSPNEVVKAGTDAAFSAWYFDRRGHLVAPRPPGPELTQIEARQDAVGLALAGGRYNGSLPDGVTVLAFPVFKGDAISGALLGRYSRQEVLQSALDRLRDDSLRALAIGVCIAILIGFLVATLITYRIQRLARSAENMAAGSLDVPLQVTGRDEVGDLARALDKMRAALQDSFQVLSSERDKLAAIFDGLTDAVMIVDNDGTVRFSNRAASELAREDGPPPEPMISHLRKAAEQGQAEAPALRIGERVYALQARDLPAEQGVLVVVRDRTEKMQQELAEREFVSNAAHELRNPLAGISGAIEVLQAGAKDDPEALDHFLRRLSADVERMNRLMQSLLTLARVEALPERGSEPVDVSSAAADAIAAVQTQDGVELKLDVEPGLAAEADPILLRQVLIGLLSNATRHTRDPGTVVVRARRANGEAVIEVVDTGSGIPAEDIDRVFERFYRSTDALAHEGFGLGLAIAKRMVQVMGGAIGAASEEGQGSVFWVRLPAAEPIPTPVA